MYKVRVEADNPDFNLDKRIQDGIDCRGFIAALFDEEGSVRTLCVEGVSSMEIAYMMSDHSVFAESMALARGIIEARKIHDENEAKEHKLDLLRKILCPEGEEDDE